LTQKATKGAKTGNAEDTKFAHRLEGLSEYMAEHLLPTLIPALVALIKALEREGGTDLPQADEDMPFDQQSVAVRVYLSRNITPILNRGLEDTFRKKPQDPIDSLANFLFERSSVEILDPEFDNVINPLHWLAQYLLRHNPAYEGSPKHQGNQSPRSSIQEGPSSPNEAYMLRPPTPTKRRNERAPTPERIASPRTYPQELEPEFDHPLNEDGTEDKSRLIICEGEKEVKVGLDVVTLQLTAYQNVSNKTMEFVATNKADGKRYSRSLNETQLQTFVGAGERFKVSNVAAAQELLGKVVLTRASKVLELGFQGYEAVVVSNRIYKGTAKINDALYIVEFRAESITVPKDEVSENFEQVLIRASVYNPNTSETCHAISREMLSINPAARQDEVEELLGKLDLATFEGREVAYMSLVTDAPCKVSGTAVMLTVGLSALGRATATPAMAVIAKAQDESGVSCTLVPLEDIEVELDQLPLVSRSYTLKSPNIAPVIPELRLDPAAFDLSFGAKEHEQKDNKDRASISERFRQARAMDVAVSAVLEMDPLLGGLMDLSEDEIAQRDRLWQMRRDQTTQKLRDQAGGTPAFRRGMIISGRYMIVTMLIISESINGSLSFKVYDPASCEEFELVVKHRDTRGFMPSFSGGSKGLLRGSKEQEAKTICKRLHLEKDTLKGTGLISLQLWEENEVSTKLRRAFDQLDIDSRGRCTKEDAKGLLEIVKKDLSEFLATHGRLQEKTSRYLEEVLQRIMSCEEEFIDFDLFHTFLSSSTSI